MHTGDPLLRTVHASTLREADENCSGPVFLYKSASSSCSLVLFILQLYTTSLLTLLRRTQALGQLAWGGEEEIGAPVTKE